MSARVSAQERVKYSNKGRNYQADRNDEQRTMSTEPSLSCKGKHGQPRPQFCPAYKIKCNKCDTIGHFARACRNGFLNKESQQQSHQTLREQTKGKASEKEIFRTLKLINSPCSLEKQSCNTHLWKSNHSNRRVK